MNQAAIFKIKMMRALSLLNLQINVTYEKSNKRLSG